LIQSFPRFSELRLLEKESDLIEGYATDNARTAGVPPDTAPFDSTGMAWKSPVGEGAIVPLSAASES